MSDRSRGALRLLPLLIAAVALVLGGGVASAAPSLRTQLKDAATGTWSGAFGTLEFHDDGTVTFSVRACGYTPVRPGFVKAFSDCEPDQLEGTLRVRTGGYVVVAKDGGEYNLPAYVDGDTLYLAPGGVATRLSRSRQGVVHLGGSELLEIGDGLCTYSAVFQKQPIVRKCKFVKRAGRTVLLYTAPDPFSGGKIGRNGLVYLSDQRLLVSPELVERPYTRASPTTTTSNTT